MEGTFEFPIWKMISDTDIEEDEYCGETVTRLTSNVRTCYLNHLQKTLIKNYDACCVREHCQWLFSREDIMKCATLMEQKALQSCMVVILYQRAMSKLVADIKRHTEHLKLYRKLKEYVVCSCVTEDKSTQVDEDFNFLDKSTQTEPVSVFSIKSVRPVCSDISKDLPSKEIKRECIEIEARSDVSLNQIIDPIPAVSVKQENPVPEEVIEGVPIPVYVSGLNRDNSAFGRTDHYLSEAATESMTVFEEIPNNTINTTNEYTVSNENNYNINIKTDPPVLNKPAAEDEPFQWSVIEENPNLSKKTIIHVKPRLRKIQRTKEKNSISNETTKENKISECIEDYNSHKMSIDERISAVVGKKVHHSPVRKELQAHSVIESSEEQASEWTIERCHQQELLHAQILQNCGDVRRRGHMRLRFLELFGSDSEDSFSMEESRSNYKDGVARLVVEKLMPYYRDGKISSRPVFKFLARQIADTLFLRHYRPGIAEVEQSILEFFSHQDIIQTVEDIRS